MAKKMVVQEEKKKSNIYVQKTLLINKWRIEKLYRKLEAPLPSGIEGIQWLGHVLNWGWGYISWLLKFGKLWTNIVTSVLQLYSLRSFYLSFKVVSS